MIAAVKNAGTTHHVATFHRKAWADAFAARIQEPGWTATNVVRKAGNVVEWDCQRYEGQSEYENWADWALTVGYYGSPIHPGTLDGVRAIPSY